MVADESTLSCNFLLQGDTEDLCLPRIPPALRGFQHWDKFDIHVAPVY